MRTIVHNAGWYAIRVGCSRQILALCLPLAVTFAFVTPTAPASAQDARNESNPPPTRVDPRQTIKALGQARSLHDRVLAADKKEGEPYPEDLVRDILAFYGKGSVGEEAPADPVVTRKFCREWVLGLLADLFQVGPCSRPDSINDPSCPTNSLEESTASKLRAALIGFLDKAFDELSFVQRARLYHLAESVLTSQDEGAVDTLMRLKRHAECGDGERELIQKTIERIE